MQLRSLFEQLQLPFGYFYTLNCGAQLGDARCKVKLSAPTWQANHAYPLGLLADAGPGAIVQPTTPNGYWYVAQYTTSPEPSARLPTLPGEGLSAADDLGPNDETQVAVGAPQNSLVDFTTRIASPCDIFTGTPVDIFGSLNSASGKFKFPVGPEESGR